MKLKINKYYLLLLFGFLYAFNLIKFSKYTINEPLIIDIIAVVLCVLILLYKKWKRYKNNFRFQIIKILSYLGGSIIDLFYYYIIIGSLIYFLFSITNQYYSDKNKLEEYELKIISAYRGSTKSRNVIRYVFKDKEVRFSMDSKEISNLAINNNLLKNHKFKVSVKKGLFNTYIIKKWEIITIY